MSNTNEVSVNIARAESMSDIQEESKFSELNKLGFVRAETAEDQWLLLVTEAWRKSKMPVNDTIAIYLSKMLNSYMTDSGLYHRLAAFNYAMHLLKAEAIEDEFVKDIADISLQYVAFVPGRNNHRHEPRSLEQSSKLGVSFYQHLALITSNKNSFDSKAYKELSKSFGLAVMVLRSVNVPFDHVVTKANDVCFADDMQASEVAKMHLLTAKVTTAVN
jgi:hypothetical protein